MTRDEFMQRLDTNANGGCWVWMRCKTTDGYGQFAYSRGGKLVAHRAHRYSWQLFEGEIPQEMHVLHRCDVPACCNPAHLFIGTHAENMADMAAKGRRKSKTAGPKNPNAKMTSAMRDEALSRYFDGGESQQAIADSLGISQTSVWRLVRGHSFVSQRADT